MRIVTLDDGVVWIFSGVDHCDGMYSSIHAAKIGELLRNSQANLPALLGPFGSVAADAGRGLSLRMDHGSQHISDDFRDQIRFWGTAPSHAFVAEPQVNGVAKRFNRSMKEQAIHGRIFET